MKSRKILPVITLLAGLLVACGGGSSAGGESKAPTGGSSAKHEHTFDTTKWEANETNHWHPATCEHTTQKGESKTHTFEVVTAESKAATCKEDGVKVEKCTVCDYKKTTNLPKGEHNYENKKTTESFDVNKCATCGATTLSKKFNSYEAGDNAPEARAADAQYKWDKGKTYAWKFSNAKAQTGAEFVIGCQLSSSSHTDRAFFVNPEGASADDQFESSAENAGKCRFTLKVNDTDVTDKVSKETYGALGLTSDAVNHIVLAKLDLPAGEFTISLTTNPTAGYRVLFGGNADVRLNVAEYSK